ncbi:MAG: hypothetical protein ACK5IJ_10380 [Mangrovibacterium sp.]
MLKLKLQREFPNQFRAIKTFKADIYVADYTQQTKDDEERRAVEMFSPNPPDNIDCFVVKNEHGLNVDGIVFDNKSFRYPDGNTKSQCEVVLFPNSTDDKSWVLLNELKYSHKAYNNVHNLLKAERQLLCTHEYYEEKGVVSLTNTSYLIASMPQQAEPFRNFRISPARLLTLKKERNIILRFQNQVEIIDNYRIRV